MRVQPVLTMLCFTFNAQLSALGRTIRDRTGSKPTLSLSISCGNAGGSLGRMLIDLGNPRSAVDLYTDLLKSGRPDAAEYDGLGDAQFALANYRLADDAYRNALRIDASDEHAARRAQSCEKILALDPVVPGIGAKERSE